MAKYKPIDHPNTRSLVNDINAWFERYLHQNKKLPVHETYQKLHEIRRHMEKTMDRLRFTGDEKTIQEELKYGQKAMTLFERFKPDVIKEVHRILVSIRTTLKQRDVEFHVEAGFNDFSFDDRISFTMRHTSSGYLLQSKENNPFQQYDNSIPTRMLGMSDDEIRNMIH